MADGNAFAGPAVGSFENDQFQDHEHTQGGLVVMLVLTLTVCTFLDQTQRQMWLLVIQERQEMVMKHDLLTQESITA